MARDSAATKVRILDAAAAEFSRYGLAGARVDRIAALAQANKQLIYAYFGNKEDLFDNVMLQSMGTFLDAVRFDAADLPGYAERFFDYFADHPELVRLARWHGLERPGVLMRLPEAAASTRKKLDALADAQARGLVDASIPAEDLLEQILALLHAGDDGIHSNARPGHGTSAGPPGPADKERTAARRAALRHAVTRLTEPQT